MCIVLNFFNNDFLSWLVSFLLVNFLNFNGLLLFVFGFYLGYFCLLFSF
ncbi:hypothetical protein N473_18145 [Pseudoalteromonas luteoviolacea CPMOR-1]|uniref:Uncharacterized protein n=1 Tax=Pseudoalteromonas luteoviolacea CPMOR-1 TaxID=1365248 RepID=A0A167KI77_9GAMM|nr:hypothetical protein N473_18145 [Pseudoalteromonas luteoviolacea CPMOR-1]